MFHRKSYSRIHRMQELYHLDPGLLVYTKEWSEYTKKSSAYQHFILDVTGALRTAYTQHQYAGLLLTLLENRDDNPKLKSLRVAIESASSQGPVAEQALEDLPFSGMRILEIGGPFGQVLHGLGAETWCVDPDIHSKSEFQKVDWNYSPVRRVNLYHPVPNRINLANWRDLVGEGGFDVVYSRQVLSINSGTSSDWRKHLLDYSHGYQEAQDEWRRVTSANNGAEAQARKDIFKVSGLVVREGGLVIHEGDALSEAEESAAEVGLLLTQRRIDRLFDSHTMKPFFGCELHVFEKQHEDKATQVLSV